MSLAQPRFNMMLLGCFAGVAMLLAAIGIYGVIAYSVAQRTREIGIRMALGAQKIDMLTMILRQSFTVIGIGLLVGLFGALGLEDVFVGALGFPRERFVLGIPLRDEKEISVCEAKGVCAEVDFSIVENPNPNLHTARDRLELHRKNPVCAGCHKITDPLGLSLENFDIAIIMQINPA